MLKFCFYTLLTSEKAELDKIEGLFLKYFGDPQQVPGKMAEVGAKDPVATKQSSDRWSTP
jgi:hypothetical protein